MEYVINVVSRCKMIKKHYSKILFSIMIIFSILSFSYALKHFGHSCHHNDECQICTFFHFFEKKLAETTPFQKCDIELIEIIITILAIIVIPYTININKTLYNQRIQFNN